MPNFRMQVILESAAPLNLPVDHIVNTFFLEDQGAILNDPAQLAQDASALWAARGSYPQEITGCRVNAYDMGDPQPREVVGSGFTAITGSGISLPRESAVCLSFYSERNIPRRRGRLYIGPWHTPVGGVRVAQSVRDAVMAIGAGIANLGGVDVDWKLYSPTTNQYHTVTDYWCDNEWDTVRSRGLKATARSTATTSEA